MLQKLIDSFKKESYNITDTSSKFNQGYLSGINLYLTRLEMLAEDIHIFLHKTHLPITDELTLEYWEGRKVALEKILGNQNKGDDAN